MTKCFLKSKIRELERELMNAKQSLKAASKRIEELEDWNMRAARDIKAYNQCIDGVIAGQCSFCTYCEEKRLGDCDRPELGTGCADWWLMDNPPVQDEGSGDDEDNRQSETAN